MKHGLTKYFFSHSVILTNIGTRLVCDPANIVGRIALVKVRLGEIMLGYVSSDKVGLEF